MDKLVYFGGPLLTGVLIQPIFWGADWKTADLHEAQMQLIAQLRQLFAGPYMQGLEQYGITDSAIIEDAYVDIASEPPSPVTLQSLADYIRSLITAGKVGDFRAQNQLLYFVFTNNLDLEIVDAAGYHMYDQLDGQTFHYAWAIAPSSAIVSHEVVEACTNPEATGYYQPQGGIEVADICEENTDARGFSNGVLAASYWSNRDSACILPTLLAKIKLRPTPGEECPVGPTIGVQSEFQVSIGWQPSWLDTSTWLPLTDAQFSWSFDSGLASAESPTESDTLTLLWTGSAPTTKIGVHVTSEAADLSFSGQLKVRVNTAAEADLLQAICRLRKDLLAINRIPPFFVHKLGPDPAPLPSLDDIARLQSFAKSLTDQVQKITSLQRLTMQS